MHNYNPSNHYWKIGQLIWSSALPGYVEENDSDYILWKSNGGVVTKIASEEELDEVLLLAGIPEKSPNPPKRTVLKSVIIARLIEAGKIELAKQALESDAAKYARWWAPDRPTINYDDPDAIALLEAIEANPEEILA